MYLDLGHTPNWDVCFAQARLTEENLRLHSSRNIKRDSACQMGEPQRLPWVAVPELYYRYDGDFEESDDGDENVRKANAALRRAASLEVLKAYGGCFASGFLALQDPLPTRPKSKLRSCQSMDGFAMERSASAATSISTSSSSCNNPGGARPDSATLGEEDTRERGRWSWRCMGMGRRQKARK